MTTDTDAQARSDEALLERAQARTSTPTQPGRGPTYNHPPIWYHKPPASGQVQGDIVRLQGDPQNRAYYEDKGFTVLRPDEVRAWERTGRARRAAAATEKALLITEIRGAAARNPNIAVDPELGDYSVAELEAYKAEIGKVVPIIRIGRGRVAAPVEEDGDRVEVAPLRDGTELAAEIARTPEHRRRSS